MDKEIRKAYLSELLKRSQEIEESDLDDPSEDVSSYLDGIDTIPYSEDQFGNHEIFSEDLTTAHRPEDISQAIEQSGKANWITTPEEARRKKIPYLYYLDPAKASPYEKYFGVKTEGGWLHTPATKALYAALFHGGAVKRFAPGPMLEVPPSYPSLPAGMKFMALDPKAESNIIAQAERMMERAQGRIEHVRTLEMNEKGEAGFTSTHEPMSGKHYSPGKEEPSGILGDKVSALETAIEKFYQEDKEGEKKLRKLHSTVNSIKASLESRMDSLLSEQRDKNRALRFKYEKGEYEDLIKQAILRIIISELTSSDGPFSDVALESSEVLI